MTLSASRRPVFSSMRLMHSLWQSPVFAAPFFIGAKTYFTVGFRARDVRAYQPHALPIIGQQNG